MNCQNCDAPVLMSDERCEKCGAKLLHHRVFLGVPKAENFTLTAEEPQREADETEAPPTHEWQFPPRVQVADQCEVRPAASWFRRGPCG